jgi:predicted nucleic acid-binding protein
MIRMAIEPTKKRRLCLTREAAEIYGCTMGRLRQMARDGQVWSEKAGPRALAFDADELEALAAARDKARGKGKLRGTPPGGFSPDT